MGFGLIASWSRLGRLAYAHSDWLRRWRCEGEIVKEVVKAQRVSAWDDVLKPEFPSGRCLFCAENLVVCVNEYNGYAGYARLIAQATPIPVFVLEDNHMDVTTHGKITEIMLYVLTRSDMEGVRQRLG